MNTDQKHGIAPRTEELHFPSEIRNSCSTAHRKSSCSRPTDRLDPWCAFQQHSLNSELGTELLGMGSDPFPGTRGSGCAVFIRGKAFVSAFICVYLRSSAFICG
jgi:hypothetical protein